MKWWGWARYSVTTASRRVGKGIVLMYIYIHFDGPNRFCLSVRLEHMPAHAHIFAFPE